MWKYFNGAPALAGVDLEASRGEVVAVVGPNGSGKTTLLRILAGLEEPDEGEVAVRGTVKMVFQENMLLPWKRLRDNVALGLLYRGVPRGEAEERVKWAAELLNFTEHLDKYPWEVSGGTARKAAIARILVLDPDVLLLDEPLAGLDVETRRSLMESLHRLAREGRTVVIADHNFEVVSEYSDRVYILSPPPGRVEAVVDLSTTPRSGRLQALYAALSAAASRRRG
ncbi:ATP-binding cassette domain-containing protein [Stetteria hydrogenophila]